VLLHELAHVRRRDLVGHTLGRLACAFYWFHPLVWTAARELRSESERACDDLALSCGTRAADYAEHLLDIVTSIRRDATPSVALAMARRKEFEGRMLAILDPHLRRANPTRAQSTALIASLAVIALVVGAAAPARRVQGQSEASQSPSPSQQQGAQGGTEQAYEQHSAPGGYDYQKISEKVTNKVTNKVTSRAVERALGPGGVADVDAIARAAANGSVSEMVRLLEAGGKGGAKDSDDRPILLAKVLRTLSSAGLVRGGRGASGGYRFIGNRRRVTLMDIVALFEPAPGSRAKEPGEDTDIGSALQRVLTEVDEIAEATLSSISLETMLKSK
jgi:hypothetical protein